MNIVFSLLIFIFLFLPGCSTPSKKIDLYPVKYYNACLKPYKIRGCWYYPQKYYHYDKVGYASWYGKYFHGRKCALGEVWDMYSMSAAHRTLPLPSIVRVENLENKKSLLLRVNDRGPFVDTKNRIIDLSYAAAKKLGFLNQGIVKVRVTCLPQESAFEAEKVFQSKVKEKLLRQNRNSLKQTSGFLGHNNGKILKEGKYYVLSKPFASNKLAKNYAKRINQFTKSKINIIKKTKNGKIKFLVVIGPFKKLDLANRLALKTKGRVLNSKL